MSSLRNSGLPKSVLWRKLALKRELSVRKTARGFVVLHQILLHIAGVSLGHWKTQMGS